MNLPLNESMVTTVNRNYLESSHAYFSNPTEEGVRVKSEDVWYAVRPTPPKYDLVDYQDEHIPDAPVPEITTGWSLFKAGNQAFYIFDQEDIKGLRKLLDTLEQHFDAEAMEGLMKDFHAGEKDADDDDHV